MTFQFRQILEFTRYKNLRVDFGHSGPSFVKPSRTRVRSFAKKHRKRAKTNAGTIIVSIKPWTVMRTPEKAAMWIAWELAHELGHYLVATPIRRRMNDYGISADHKRTEAQAKRWEIDEAKATLVEHYLRKHFRDARAQVNPLVRYRKKSLERRGIDVTALLQWWADSGKALVDAELVAFRLWKKTPNAVSRRP